MAGLNYATGLRNGVLTESSAVKSVKTEHSTGKVTVNSRERQDFLLCAAEALEDVDDTLKLVEELRSKLSLIAKRTETTSVGADLASKELDMILMRYVSWRLMEVCEQ